MVIRGLKQGTIYVFQVRARTVAGFGRYSGKLYFQTMTEGENSRSASVILLYSSLLYSKFRVAADYTELFIFLFILRRVDTQTSKCLFFRPLCFMQRYVWSGNKSDIQWTSVMEDNVGCSGLTSSTSHLVQWLVTRAVGALNCLTSILDAATIRLDWIGFI